MIMALEQCYSHRWLCRVDDDDDDDDCNVIQTCVVSRSYTQ